MGDAMSGGGQERHEISRLTGSPESQSGNVVRAGQSP
jgi:hypothetical protein